MPNEVKLLPCPFCGEHLIEIPETKLCHRYWEHPDPADGECYLRTETVSDIHVERWNHRPTTLVTDEVVERVAAAMRKQPALSPATKGYPSGDMVDFIMLARAAIEAMPTVVTGEQPVQSVGVPASPSGHSPKGGAASSTASPAKPSVPNAARDTCNIPPQGWWCSREAGHEGPCAARPMALDQARWFVMNIVDVGPERPSRAKWSSLRSLGQQVLRRLDMLGKLPSTGPTPSGHEPDCDWHCEQYPWDCTCGHTASVDGRRMAETENTGSVPQGTTSAVANGETPTPSSAQPGDA